MPRHYISLRAPPSRRQITGGRAESSPNACLIIDVAVVMPPIFTPTLTRHAGVGRHVETILLKTRFFRVAELELSDY